MYQTTSKLEFGSIEIFRLIDCGLKHISHENVPLWRWYSLYKETYGGDFLPYKSFSDEDVSIGALEAMTLIGSTLPSVAGPLDIDRNGFITHWLSESSSDSKKLAALRYLKHHGKDEDLTLIQSELDRADSKTSRNALEAIVSIQIRYNREEAIKIAFSNQFESFDEVLLQEVLSVSSNLDNEILKLGLRHRNKSIRLESFKRLRERKKINADELKELKNDQFAVIRKEVIDFQLSNNQPLSDEEVKTILVKPKKGGMLTGLFALAPSDEDGKACYDEYLLSKYSNMSEKELSEIINRLTILVDIPYFALCSRHFKNHSEELRGNVDDQFKGKYEEHMEYIRDRGASDEAIQEYRSIEEYIRKKSTRKALDILCKKGDAKDLDRIRKNMRSDYVKSSENEIEYMRKWGEWEDIPFIVKAEQDSASTRTSLTMFSNYSDWYCSVAEAIYRIGKDRLGELLKIEMPSSILVGLIKTCSPSKFSEIPDVTILDLLNREVAPIPDTVKQLL